MIAVIVAIVLATAVGGAIVWRIDDSPSFARATGAGFLLGIGVFAAILFATSLAGIAWTRALIFIAAFGVIASTFVRHRSRVTASPYARDENWKSVAVLLELTIGILVCGHAVFATLAPLAEHDFLAIWGLKGKLFFHEGGIDWRFLESQWNAFAHPEYPLLVPLSFDLVAVLRGAWEERWIGLLYTAMGGSALLIAWDAFRRETGRVQASLGTLALAGCALSPWIGLADGPFLAYEGAGLLLLREGVLRSSRRSLVLGSIFVGFAACTKNEGLALLVATIVALVLCRHREWRYVAPAILIPLPWLLIRSYLHLESDLFEGSVVSHMLDRLRHLGDLFAAIASHRAARPVFWAGVVCAVFANVRDALRRERLILIAVAVQFGLYFAVYLGTANDVAWQVRWSWERVMSHLLLPLAFAALMLVFRRDRVEDPA